MSLGPCAKAAVQCVLLLRDGRRFHGANLTRHAVAVCPRIAAGHGRDDYRLCGPTGCHQIGHAEEVAVAAALAAGADLRGAVAYVGHHRCCDRCRALLTAHGVERIVLGEPPAERDALAEERRCTEMAFAVAVAEMRRADAAEKRAEAAEKLVAAMDSLRAMGAVSGQENPVCGGA